MNVFIYINERPFNLDDYPEIADLDIFDAIQALLNKGLFGEDAKGLKVTDLYENLSIDFIKRPEEDDLVGQYAYQEFKDFEAVCSNKVKEGTFTEEDANELERLNLKQRAIRKLIDD